MCITMHNRMLREVTIAYTLCWDVGEKESARYKGVFKNR